MTTPPPDAEARRAVPPVVAYPPDALPPADLTACAEALAGAAVTAVVDVPPREARLFRAPAGSFFRISCPEAPQVGDLNLWAAGDWGERFYSGKTRAIHGTHVSTGDRLWSSFPHLRPMATIVADSLDWYGVDADGLGVHDVIGTRCDPYTARLLTGRDYDRCCHSNIVRALVREGGLAPEIAETTAHDVLNVFMCTGFDRATGRYLMKATPARAGDALTCFAEIDLVGALSACPGGDCGATHSSDEARCAPLRIETLAPLAPPRGWAAPAKNPYAGRHGL
ncbi:urea carboxylase-associated family protein [Rubrimonas cliftonensis]|nr:DUF1989 domain-containing protein [Rubrimonas cliftonensis]